MSSTEYNTEYIRDDNTDDNTEYNTDDVRYQQPSENVNREMISLRFLYDFVDTVVGKDIFVFKGRNKGGSSIFSNAFEFRLKNYSELSSHKYMIEFSLEDRIEYDKSKFHLKGYILSKSRKEVRKEARKEEGKEARKEEGKEVRKEEGKEVRKEEGGLIRRYMFDLHDNMFSIHLPDKSMIAFDLEESPIFRTGSIVITIDYYKYSRYM
jgi:hypothetical protein